MYVIADTYQHIADILSFEVPNNVLESTLSQPNFNWDAIVIEGSKHLVLPAIYCRLQSKSLLHLLPEDLSSYLEELTAINRNRNTALIEQIKTVSELLNQHQINHVFLKGAALLASGYYEDKAERMVGDIDILVERSQTGKAFEILKQNGYDKTFGFAYDNKDFRHMDRLISDNLLAAVELHSDLLEHPCRHLINTDSLLNQKVKVEGIAIPNSYYMSLHNLLAWQINDNGFYYKTIHFKHLYDSIVLNRQENTSLIADVLKHKFGQAYFELAKHYFNDFPEVSSTKSTRSYLKSHQNYLTKPFYRKVLKPLKYGFKFIKHRLHETLFNPSYRNHALKKIFLNKK